MMAQTVPLVLKLLDHKCCAFTTSRWMVSDFNPISIPSQYLFIYFLGQICDKHGAPLPPGTHPPPWKSDRGNNDWTPFKDWVQFKTTNFLFCHNQMSAGNINIITGLWEVYFSPHHNSPPFTNAKDLYDTIDSTPLGDTPWQSFTLIYKGPLPESPGPNGENPPWTIANCDIWFCDACLLVQEMISNPDFTNGFKYMPYQEYSADGQHHFEDFMPGDWAWKQVVSGSQTLQTHLLQVLHRIRSLWITLGTRELLLSPLFSGVTRQWCLLLLVKPSIGQSTYQSVTLATMCDVHITMVSCFSAS